MNIDFEKRGSYPKKLNIVLVDEERRIQDKDAFVIDDFSTLEDNCLRSHTYVEDTGEFLMCRVK